MITFPSNTKDTIDDIRNAIGRNVIFRQEIKSLCSGCTLDPVTNTSTDPFCPVCSGYGYTYISSGISILAHITWGQSEDVQWVTGGKYYDGDCRIQVEYSSNIISMLDSGVDHVEVDGKNMHISKRIYRGFPDLNRIILELKEE